MQSTWVNFAGSIYCIVFLALIWSRDQTIFVFRCVGECSNQSYKMCLIVSYLAEIFKVFLLYGEDFTHTYFQKQIMKSYLWLETEHFVVLPCLVEGFQYLQLLCYWGISQGLLCSTAISANWFSRSVYNRLICLLDKG